ncbi:MAG TPA: hypothetical protein VFH75_02475 [Actinomycetota bacterium]|nr:hypothetical protein [Actinomycetota bacterium]
MEDREKIMDVMSDKTLRGKFKSDPKQTLTDAGVTDSPEVEELSATMAQMSPQELEGIAKLNKKMVEMGMTEGGSSHLGRAV